MAKTVYSFGIIGGGLLLGVAQQAIPFHLLVIYAAIISLVGGIASGTRKTSQWYVLVQYGLNLMIFGVSITLLSVKILDHDNFDNNLIALGAVGLLVLGGFLPMDLVVDAIREWIKREAEAAMESLARQVNKPLGVSDVLRTMLFVIIAGSALFLGHDTAQEIGYQRQATIEALDRADERAAAMVRRVAEDAANQRAAMAESMKQYMHDNFPPPKLVKDVNELQAQLHVLAKVTGTINTNQTQLLDNQADLRKGQSSMVMNQIEIRKVQEQLSEMIKKAEQ